MAKTGSSTRERDGAQLCGDEYDDTAITGFIGTHQPAIWMGDYGYVTLMPQVGELRTTPETGFVESA